MKKYISWRRVSTKKQGESKLGLEAQKDIIAYFTADGELLADYSEVYTGKDLEGCTELKKAIQHCKESGATLVLAKTDRFRNVRQALGVMEQLPNQIMFCDLPNSDEFTLTLFFALAEREAKILSIRTKAGLAAKKKREGSWSKEYGKNTGTTHAQALSKARKASSYSRTKVSRDNENNKRFWAYVQNFKTHSPLVEKKDYDALANLLNEIGLRTATGLEFDYKRAQAMYNKCKKFYQYKY